MLLRFAAKIVNAFRDAPMSRQGVPSTSFTSSAPDGDPLDLTVGANFREDRFIDRGGIFHELAGIAGVIVGAET